ncbi:hypothetical protein PVAND_017012 [Polypedilum vanderplanki]|uniref:Uncharacterized protein n=1 Tax=Polypedilum vanderplanki TaxID=319348 RepID=A0A9J6BGZ1_POLVA|nr:hypothetical protein PVAND_017012 [Polypedilum vanderplanki]
MVKNSLTETHFQNYSLFYEFSGLFIENYEKFWMNLEKHTKDHRNLLREILLHTFKDHPLILALRYNMKNILRLYFKYCNIEEISNILVENAESLIENLEEIKSIEKLKVVEDFLMKIFTNNEGKIKELMSKRFNENKFTILSYLHNAIDEYKRHNENECKRIAENLLKIFKNLQGNVEILDNIENICGVKTEKRALGVKYFNSITLLPMKHSKRVITSIDVPKFIIDP